MEQSEKCSRDGCKEPRTSNKPWCLKHLADYQKNYRGTVMDMAERRGFHAGVKAMRDSVSGEFGKHPGAFFSGAEVARIVRDVAPSPAFDATVDSGRSLES